MEAKEKKAEEKEKQVEVQKLKPNKLERRRQAKWKLWAMLATLVMCSILMLQLVVDEPSEAELIVYDFAREQGISALQYPESLVELLEHNPETKEFVLNYPFREEEPEIDLSAIDLSYGVPQFMQWDQRWGYMTYGDEMVAISGSGPMCLAMAGYYLTEDASFYPNRVVKFADESQFDLDGGSKWSVVTQGCPLLGLEAMELSAVEDKVGTYLNSGKPIIAVMGPGVFGDGEHFIVMTAYNDGKVKVNDPASYAKSTDWDFDEIRKQIEILWVIQEAKEG